MVRRISGLLDGLPRVRIDPFGGRVRDRQFFQNRVNPLTPLGRPAGTSVGWRHRLTQICAGRGMTIHPPAIHWRGVRELDARQDRRRWIQRACGQTLKEIAHDAARFR
jgi:hypothetical protein